MATITCPRSASRGCPRGRAVDRQGPYAAERLTAVPGCDPAVAQPFFKEFMLKLPKPPERVAAPSGQAENILPGCRSRRLDRKLGDCLLVAVTERRTKDEIDDAFAERWPRPCLMPYDNQRAYDRLVLRAVLADRLAFSLPESDVPVEPALAALPEKYRRTQAAALPEVSELDVVRHYSRLSQMNYGVDTHFYPLGSCTMKYNPKINEDMARLSGFGRLHPLAPPALAQGALELMHGWPRCWPRSPAWTRCRCSRRRRPGRAGRRAHDPRLPRGARGEAHQGPHPDSATHQSGVDGAGRLRGDRGEVGRRGRVDLGTSSATGARRGGVMITVPNTLGTSSRA